MPVTGMRVTQQSVTQTIQAFKKLDARVAIAAGKKAARKAGQAGLKALRGDAPKGMTGQFRRSLDYKVVNYTKDRNFIAVIGQRSRSRAFTQKQVAMANRRSGRISKGLSGAGWAPAIWWIESGTKAHQIKARNKTFMYWNVTKGRQRFAPAARARTVQHPGHKGTGFTSRSEPRIKVIGQTIISRELQAALKTFTV